MSPQIVVSDKLAAFIEKEFQLMLKFQKELKEQREVIRPELRRKEQRESKRIKRKGGIVEKETSKSAIEIALKGKAHLDFNNFIYMCDYLLQKENQEAIRLEICHRKDIHHWISDFLNQMGYKKDNGKPYTNSDIKRVINYQFEDYSKDIYGQPNYDKSLKEHFGALIDHMYEDFGKRSNKPISDE